MFLSAAKPTPAPFPLTPVLLCHNQKRSRKSAMVKEKGNARKQLKGGVWKEPLLFLSGIFSRDVKIRACFISEM